jgi:hypothetical protein
MRKILPSTNSILSDHKRIGKRFIPPFFDGLGTRQDYSWMNQILPELIWISCLNRYFGLKRGAELVVALSMETRKQFSESPNWFATVSSYSTLTSSQTETIIASLTGLKLLEEIRSGLFQLLSLYPKCPLAFLYQKQSLSRHDYDIILEDFSTLVRELFDRTSYASTFMQGTALYIGFANKLLRVVEDTLLAQFQKLQEYPNTELSLKIASSVRASIPMVVFEQEPPFTSDWANYFWNRGLELVPCEIEVFE